MKNNKRKREETPFALTNSKKLLNSIIHCYLVN
jgi:hypothetical protein